MHKHAFKMGFSFKLAEARITPGALVDLVQRCKLAKDEEKGEKKGEKKGKKDKGSGAGLGDMAGVLKPIGLGLGGALTMSGVLPAAFGRVGGGMLASGLENQMDTTDELRARYLIKRYNDYIRERKAQLNNKLVSEVLRG